MCKIIPSPSSLFPTQPAEATQEFDAWFESINKELSMKSNQEKVDYYSQPQLAQYPFEMEMPEMPLSEYSSPFSMGSPVESAASSTLCPDVDLKSLSYTPAAPIAKKNAPKTNITVEYVSRPSKANNVKRSSPEDPITAEVALKRQKQNEAARRCRQKRLSQLQECQQKVEQVEKEKFDLSVRLAVLEKEKEAWILKEQEMNMRMEKLRAQLDQSHHTLLSMN
jgi:hypothetical protein